MTVRGIRNRNPGNIEGQHFGAVGNDGRFAIYATMDDGLRAIERQLTRYYNGQTTGQRLQTIRSMISTWAPSAENDTPAYISSVAQRLGVSPDQPLAWGDPNTRAGMVRAIIDVENGRGHGIGDADIRAALSIGGPLPAGQPSGAPRWRTVTDPDEILAHLLGQPASATPAAVAQQPAPTKLAADQPKANPAKSQWRTVTDPDEMLAVLLAEAANLSA